MRWVLMPLRRYADFRGRSRRLEFWSFQLGLILTYIVISLITLGGVRFDIYGADAADLASPAQFSMLFWLGLGLAALVWLALFIPSLAVTIRRLHDRGLSGWWYGGLFLASFIPLVNIIAFFGYLALLVVLLLPGTDGPNQYGPDPKDPSEASVFE